MAQKIQSIRGFNDVLPADSGLWQHLHDTARGVFDVFVSLARSRGTAIVIVTHDPALAAQCDRVMRLAEGRLVPA